MYEVIKESKFKECLSQGKIFFSFSFILSPDKMMDVH